MKCGKMGCKIIRPLVPNKYANTPKAIQDPIKK